MISDMRKHFQSPFYKAAVWVGVVALAGIFSIPTLIKERNPNPWVIKVNNFEIGAKEFNWALVEKHEWLSMVRAQYGEQTDFLLQAFGIMTDPVSLAMEAVIKDSLISDLASRMNLCFHSHTVQERLVDPGFIKYYLGSLVPPSALSGDGFINTAILKNFLARKGMKPAEFEEQVERAIERKMVMDIFAVGAYVPLFDRNALYHLSRSQRTFDILTFSYQDQFEREKKQPLSQEDIERYYALKKGSSAYQIPEKRSGIAWSFDAQDYDIEVSDADIERYYQDHKAQLYVKSPKKIEVRHILMKNDHPDAEQKAQAVYDNVIKNPETFADQARHSSEDEETAAQGGLIKPFARGEKDAMFERAAFLLKKDGDISPIIKTDKGFEIIQRVKIIQPVYQEIDQVSKAIRETLLRDKFLTQFATDCKNMKIKSQKDKNKVISFVNEKNGIERAISFAPENESHESKTLFGIRALNGFDFCFDKNKGYIVQLTSLSKAYTADLSEVKDAVVEEIYHERTQESLKKIAQDALSTASQAPQLDSIKKTYGGTTVTTAPLLPDEIEKSDAIKKRGIDASIFGQLEFEGLTRLVINEHGAHIIKVKKRVDNETANEGEKEEMNRIQQQRKRVMAESFVASLYRNATIKTNESMINLQKNYSL